MPIEFLNLADIRLAYQRLDGDPRKIGVLFLGGFASDMTGTKASDLAERCAADNRPYVRFDYRGNGQSNGDFKDGTLGAWLADSCAVLEQLTVGKQIIIGSSMGGWLGMMLARRYPERVKAFIGIAAAPDFTEDMVLPQLTAEQRVALERDGEIWDGHAPITKKLIEEAWQHLQLRDAVPITCSVRLLQGMRDDAVPWNHALHIAEKISGDDVRVTLIKDGDHRLSRPQDLEMLWEIIQELAG